MRIRMYNVGFGDCFCIRDRKSSLLVDFGAANSKIEGRPRREVFDVIISDLTTIRKKNLLLTHFHPDHAAGNGEFEAVHLSEGEKIDAPSTLTPGAVPFDLSKLPHPDYEKIYVKDGEVIELGNRTIEVLDVKPAHCNSSLFFLDRKARLLLCGDEIDVGQVMMFDNSQNLEAPYDVRERMLNFRANMQRVKDLDDAYDWLLPNHNGYPIAKSYVDEFIGLADAVFAGTAVIEDQLNHPFVEMDPKADKLCRVRFKRVSIFIEKEELMKIYGKQEG